MKVKGEGESFLDVDVSSLSHEHLVEVIKQLEGSAHITLRKKAQKELVKRLKAKGFSNKRIAMLLVSNIYGKRKRLAIIEDWAEALEISENEFIKLISG
ncbi:MAG: hypothetical protein HY805_02920 [Nitrospirae bacterium]|nr:hypothetical protein [Nitrospirota bacterium]